jgi:hypothetical protein
MPTYELIELEDKFDHNKRVTGADLAAALESCGENPPRWLIEAVCSFLRDPTKRRPGRPPVGSPRYASLIESAGFKYEQYLNWLQQRKRKSGLPNWTCLKKASWWSGALHERAAKMAHERYKRVHPQFKSIDVRHFRNLIKPEVKRKRRTKARS